MEQNAWKVVYDELIKVPLFRGHYDARNGSEQCMHGICTVMEKIAYHVSKECADNFVELFVTNMIGSRMNVSTVRAINIEEVDDGDDYYDLCVAKMDEE